MLKEKEEKESWTGVPRRSTVSPAAGQSGVGTSVWIWGDLCGNKNEGRRQKHAWTGT